ncbi:hypothetical protein ACS0TY_013075 [Phlomoides rotata]
MDIEESPFLFSVEFADYGEGSPQELKEIIHGLMGVFGRPNVADSFPILGMLDPQGINREAEFYMGKLQAIFDGTDTTSGTVEWAMTELLRNPKVLSKAQKELQAVIRENKQVEESDISNLPYLQAVINETFRYHPPGPFLARRKDENDVKIDN